MTALYELAADMRAAIEQLATLDIDEQTYLDTLEGFQAPFEEKVANVAKYIRNQEVLAAAIKEQEAALKARRESIEKGVKRLTEYLRTHMAGVSVMRVERPDILVKLDRAAPTLLVEDSAKVPEPYWRYPPPPERVLDRRQMLADLKAGAEIPGTRLVTDGYHVRIK